MGNFRRASVVALVSVAVTCVGLACTSFGGEGSPAENAADGSTPIDIDATPPANDGAVVSTDGSAGLDATGPCGSWLCESFEDPGNIDKRLLPETSGGTLTISDKAAAVGTHSLEAAVQTDIGKNHSALYRIDLPAPGASTKYKSVRVRAKLKFETGGGYFLNISIPSLGVAAVGPYVAELVMVGKVGVEEVGYDGGDRVYVQGKLTPLALSTTVFHEVELSVEHVAAATLVSFSVDGSVIDSHPTVAAADLDMAATLRLGIDNYSEGALFYLDDLRVDYALE